MQSYQEMERKLEILSYQRTQRTHPSPCAAQYQVVSPFLHYFRCSQSLYTVVCVVSHCTLLYVLLVATVRCYMYCKSLYPLKCAQLVNVCTLIRVQLVNVPCYWCSQSLYTVIGVVITARQFAAVPCYKCSQSMYTIIGVVSHCTQLQV